MNPVGVNPSLTNTGRDWVCNGLLFLVLLRNLNTSVRGNNKTGKVSQSHRASLSVDGSHSLIATGLCLGCPSFFCPEEMCCRGSKPEAVGMRGN